MQSRRLVRPVQPADEARLRALAKALEGVPLPAATSAIESGRVLDARTGERVAWVPVPTILPVSDRLKAVVEGPEHEEAVARETGSFEFRLGP
jgi:hypothetical protein